MKLLLPSLLFLLLTTASLSADVFISDGNSLARGIELYRKADGGTNLTQEEMITVASTGAFLNGFLRCSQLWSMIDSAAPFKVPADVIPPLQMLKIVEKYFKENPDLLHESASVLVLMALKENFPNPAYKK